MEKQQAALTAVGNIEEAMVKGFPFTVPSEYDNLPQLKVRLRASVADARRCTDSCQTAAARDCTCTGCPFGICTFWCTANAPLTLELPNDWVDSFV